jgi:hypothetical protein
MWEYEYSVETTAAPEALWHHWSDMAAWPQWNDGIETDFPEVLAALAKRSGG